MPDSDQYESSEQDASGLASGKSVTRRQFLKIAAIAGASVGVGGGLLAACGGSGTPTSTSAEAPTTTTTSVETSTSVTSAPTAGREIKIGFVSPQTGPLAFFGVPDKYCLARWNEFAAGGLVCGDNQKHPISIVMVDSQSDTNRAAQVASDLINNDKVDLLMVASAGDTVNPVSEQAEAYGMPCLCGDNPAEGFFAGRKVPADGFKWSYLAFWSNASQADVVVGMWSQVATNKVVGALWPNDLDGAGYRVAFPPVLQAQGYSVVDAGEFQDGTEDFTSIIQKFKAAGVEILAGTMITPDFDNFYKQAKQQGLNPKIAAIGKATTFPEGAASLGSLGTNMATSIIWSSAYPYKSSLTGETCAQLAADYEAKIGSQYSPAILHYALFEWAVDVLKRTTSIGPQTIIDAVKTTKLDTIDGTFDFQQPVDPKGNRPWINDCLPPNVAGQWVKGTGKWPFDLVICDVGKWTDVPVQGKLLPLP